MSGVQGTVQQEVPAGKHGGHDESRRKEGERGRAPLGLAMLIPKSKGTGRLERCSGKRTLTGAGGPGPSASPPLLSLDEPGLKRGPGEVPGPTPQSPTALGLCTG